MPAPIHRALSLASGSSPSLPKSWAASTGNTTTDTVPRRATAVQPDAATRGNGDGPPSQTRRITAAQRVSMPPRIGVPDAALASMQRRGPGNGEPSAPSLNAQGPARRTMLLRELEPITQRRSLPDLRSAAEITPQMRDDYREVIARYDRLRTRTSVSSIDRAVTAHLRDRIPADFQGPIIVLLCELHETCGAMAQTLPTLDAFSDKARKMYLIEGTPQTAEDEELDATKRAYDLLASFADQPRSEDAGKLTQAEFAERAVPGTPPRHLASLVMDTCAKLTDYKMRGFDVRHDDWSTDPDGRELAMAETIAGRAAQNDVTVVRTGLLHGGFLHQVLAQGMPDAKVIAICQAVDPSPDSAMAIDRMKYLMNHRDVLMLAGSDALERDSVDMRRFALYAATRPAVQQRLLDDLRHLGG